MTINNEFEIEETVYLTTDVDQRPYMVVGILVSVNGLLYELRQAQNNSYHYGCEISRTKCLII